MNQSTAVNISDAGLLSPDRVKRLVNHWSEHCISIYMPTHRAGQQTRQDPIRFGNLIDRARDQLVEGGLGRPDASALLEPIAALRDEPDFWRHLADGLAVYCSPELHEIYRLPIDFTERVIIGRRFHLKPIFPLMRGDGRFFILAISQKHVRLLECSRNRFAPIHVANMPEGRSEIMKHIEHEKSLQYHSGTGQFRPNTGIRAAVYHGQGAIESDIKDRIGEFFRHVNDALVAALHDQRAPLVFAGVDYLFPIYQRANKYPHLFDQPVAGNPDGLDDAELHRSAWQLIKPHFDQDRHEQTARIREAHGTGRASADLNAVLNAAHDGIIETLFVACDQSRWGRYDRDRREAELHDDEQPGDEDLLDAAVIHTILHRGRVYAVRSEDMPLPSAPVAALLRY